MRLEKEDPNLAYSMQLLETSVQLCTPSPPLQFPKTLTGSAHLMHPLSGEGMSLEMNVAVADALASGSVLFDLPLSLYESNKQYLLTVYMESPSAKFEARIHQGY